MILTFMEEGARAVISFCIRSAMPMYCFGSDVSSGHLGHCGKEMHSPWWYHQT